MSTHLCPHLWYLVCAQSFLWQFPYLDGEMLVLIKVNLGLIERRVSPFSHVTFVSGMPNKLILKTCKARVYT